MRYKIIDEEVVESLIKFLDEIQFGTAEHGMKKSTVEIVNICSYFISELLDAEEVIDNESEDDRKRIDNIIEFQMGEMPEEDYEKLLKQFDSFFKNFNLACTSGVCSFCFKDIISLSKTNFLAFCVSLYIF